MMKSTGSLPLLPFLFLFSFLFLFLFCGSCATMLDLPETPVLDWIARIEDQRRPAKEVFPFLDHSSPLVRHRAALALARLRDPEAVPEIARVLAYETDLRVTEMLLFALGQIGAREGLPVIEVFMKHDKETIRAAAFEAAGKTGDPASTSEILACLKEDPSPRVRGEACLALYHLEAARGKTGSGLSPEIRKKRTSFLCRTMLDDQNADVRWKAAFTLAAIHDPASAQALSKAMDDANVWVRTFAARGLGAMPPSGDIQKILTKSCDDPDWPVAVESIKSLKKYNNLQAAITLIHLLSPGVTMNTHIRATAARALGAVTNGGNSTVKALMQACLDFSLAVEGNAIVALGEIGGLADNDTFLSRILEHQNSYLRLKAAEGASLMKDDGLDILLTLAEDASIRVRCKAMEGLKALPQYRDGILPLVEENLAIDDMTLHYFAAEVLAAFKVKDEKDIRLLKDAYRMDQAKGTEADEARTRLFDSIMALEEPVDPDFLWEALKDENFGIRKKAADRLSTLPGLVVIPEPPKWSPFVFPVAGIDYLTGKPDPLAHFFTEKGEFWIELFPDMAPFHVKSFIRLAKKGQYDNLKFHRVVPDFVVQGLDPRGDGWGRGGVVLRDEINRLKFYRSYVGTPTSGPDTGGCQIFITLCHTPRLDGKYTVFGKVVSGMNVVDALQEEDHVIKVTIEE